MPAVIQAAEILGWRYYHTHNSKRSPSGFPDLVLVRRGRIIFAELKVGSNVPTPAQQEWIEDLDECEGVDVYVWTPDDWPEIKRALRVEI